MFIVQPVHGHTNLSNGKLRLVRMEPYSVFISATLADKLKQEAFVFHVLLFFVEVLGREH